MIHKFEDDNAIGKRGEAIFRKFLEKRGCVFQDVSENAEYQERDIDFVVNSKKEAGKTVSVEVKNDTRIAETRNIFFETMSNVDYSTKGCFSKTEAELIAIVSERERKIYFVNTIFLREFVDGNAEKLRFISRVPGSNSCGYLIPLKMLGKNVVSIDY